MSLLDAQLAAGVNINATRFARQHGVSVRTVYRHRARVREDGEWRPRSRRPHRNPTATPPELEAWICKLRAGLSPDNGADFIRDGLLRVHAETSPPWQVPARSTINRVLDRHDLLERNPAKRPRSSWRRFCYARPRDCYQIDATVVALAGGGTVVAFDVIDDCSRKLVACHAAHSETTRAAVAAITKAVDEHGAPGLVLSDNGIAFTNRLTHPGRGLSSFTRAVNSWGTRLIHSSPYHPQTCGKVERHHQTLKKWLATQRPPANLRELQRLLDIYREYYNTHRRHSALSGRVTPHQAWTTAASHGGPSNLPIQVDATVHRCTVYDTGTICVGGHRMSVGRALIGTTLTAIRDGDRATIYTPDGQPLGHAYLDPAKAYVRLTRTE
jgi:putative transposase